MGMTPAEHRARAAVLRREAADTQQDDDTRRELVEVAGDHELAARTLEQNA